MGTKLLVTMKKRRGFSAMIVLVIMLLSTVTVGAFTPYDSYTYSTAMGYVDAVPSPAPYIPKKYLDANALGVDLSRPCDFDYSPDGNLFVVDAELNKIIIIDPSFKVINEIKGFEVDGQHNEFKGPRGLFLTADGLLYICDTENERIVVLDQNFNFVEMFQCPQTPLLGEKYGFKPIKITVDESNTMYVINTNEYSGLMKISPKGEFVSFVGSNKAIVNPLVKFWKKIMSEEQQKQLLTFIPVEYNNIFMDSDGFIYSVSASKSEKTPIRRLNLSGTDILIRSGYTEVVGDVLYQTKQDSGGEIEDKSVMVDICASSNGNYYALDSNKGRIFTYNQEGFLLYVFGGKGTQIGTFTTPSAIECNGDNLLVLDEVSAAITVFEKTEYAKQITDAEDFYYRGEFDQSMQKWQDVLKSNAFYELAYLQMGKIYLQQDNNQDAMKCFELGNYRGDKITFMTGYNKAFTELRKTVMQNYLSLIIIVAIVAWLSAVIIKRYKKGSKQINMDKSTSEEL